MNSPNNYTLSLLKEKEEKGEGLICICVNNVVRLVQLHKSAVCIHVHHPSQVTAITLNPQVLSPQMHPHTIEYSQSGSFGYSRKFLGTASELHRSHDWYISVVSSYPAMQVQ